MGMTNYWRMRYLRFPLSLYKDADCHALLDIKDILIFCAVGSAFFLLGIAVQVKDVDFVEAVHKALAHATEGGIIEVAVIGNEGEDAIAGLFDAPLCESDELDIII